MSKDSSPPEAGPWADLSRRLGQDLLMTQASGGNTSVKLDDRRFLVKASGLRLGEVTTDKGWVLADYQAIRKGVPDLDRQMGVETKSNAYQTLLTSSLLTRGPKISLEAGLHALLPNRWVAHVHSIAGQLLGLMPEEEARDFCFSLWGEDLKFCWIPPAVPGHELCSKVAENRMPNVPQGQTVNLWILQNHGIAWGSDSDKKILGAVDAFEEPLRKRFGLHRYPPPVIEPLASHAHPAQRKNMVPSPFARLAHSVTSTRRPFSPISWATSTSGPTPHPISLKPTTARPTSSPPFPPRNRRPRPSLLRPRTGLHHRPPRRLVPPPPPRRRPRH
jgi:rhamnose utilization protein RhaD (predicted bifunctional aldolase and dehydrogenase)